MPHDNHATSFEDAARTALTTVFAHPRHEWEPAEQTCSTHSPASRTGARAKYR
ncbi:hypothetical protein [Streptomyces sp. NPDC004629]|uniref:hypothetical protein n=1 Tax=Streptomyces sp. NPDC004629 TaxID=3364705 RepID=UPI0036B900AE